MIAAKIKSKNHKSCHITVKYTVQEAYNKYALSHQRAGDKVHRAIHRVMNNTTNNGLSGASVLKTYK